MGVRKSQRRRRRHRDQRRSNRAFDGFHRDRIAGDDQRNTRARLARRSGLHNTPGAIVKRDSSGNFSAGAINAATSFNLGANPFAFGTYANQNAFLGFAGTPR